MYRIDFSNPTERDAVILSMKPYCLKAAMPETAS